MKDLLVAKEPLPGVFVLNCPYSLDGRGDFVKLFHSEALLSQGISFKPAESFLTRSKRDVLRGIHFQIGEAAHEKLVVCIKGRVLDVIVDVRPNSPNFNKPFSIELSESSNISLLIGKGYGHGFFTLSEDNWMLYSTTKIHNPSLDRGVLWNSIAFNWPNEKPLTSQRDSKHPRIQDLT